MVIYDGLFIISYVQRKSYAFERGDYGDSKGDFLPETCLHLVSPSRSPAAPPARTTVFSSCCRTPDFPQKCSRQPCPRQLNELSCSLIGVRAFTIGEPSIPQTFIEYRSMPKLHWILKIQKERKRANSLYTNMYNSTSKRMQYFIGMRSHWFLLWIKCDKKFYKNLECIISYV